MRFKNTIRLTVVVCAFVFGFLLIGSQKVEAVSVVTNEFPRGGNYFFVSRYGDGHLLHTPVVTARVFYDTTKAAYKNTSGNLQIQVRGYCRGSGSGVGTAEMINFNAGSNSSQNLSNCSGLNSPLNTITFSISKANIVENKKAHRGFPADYYGPNVGYTDIQITSGNVNVPIAVKVVATNGGGMVTMRESPPGWQNVPFNPTPNPPVTGHGARNPFGEWEDLRYATAIWNNMNNNGSSTHNDFAFRFQSSCTYNSSGSTPVRMRWYDADDGGLNGDTGAQRNGPSYDTSIRWRLVDSNTSPATNIATRPSGTLGGDDEYRETSSPASLPNQSEITWIWENVSATNGIQIWLPFSEINVYLKDNNLCDGVKDLCTNIPGIQDRVPDGMVKTPSTPDVPGTCGNPPYSGGGCYFVVLGDPSRVWHSGSYQSGTMSNKLRVVVYNNTRWLWQQGATDPNNGNQSAWVVYLRNTSGNLNDGGGAQTPNFGTSIPRMPNGTDTRASGFDGSQAYFDYNIDVTTPGTRTVSFEVRRYQGPGNDNLVNGDATSTCTMTYEITDAPQIEAFTADCRVISFRVRWASGRSDPINVSMSADDGSGARTRSQTVNPSTTYEVSTHNGWNNVSLLGDKLKPWGVYGINLSAGAGANAGDNIGSCMTASCTVSPTSLTTNTRTYVDAYYRITNFTNVPYGIDGSVTAGGNVIIDPPTSFVGTSPGNGAGSDIGRKGENGNPLIVTGTGGAGWLIMNLRVDSVDPTGEMTIAGNCGTDSDNTTELGVYNRPYIKAYNSDVAAGGGFRTSEACTTGTGGSKGIFAYMNSMTDQTSSLGALNPGKGGSGSQLGSFAWGTAGNIEGFTSANTNSNNLISGPGLYLTFGGGNQASINTSSSLSPHIGGNLNGNIPCIPDYYGDTQYLDGSGFIEASNSSITGNESIDPLTAKQFKIDTDATIGSTFVDFYQGRRTYYIDGNLTISKDIKYFSYSNIKDIPNFTVVVKGNIYIAPGVSQLDGVYIAQPTDASGANGRIFTCNDGSPTFAITYDACSTQLKVNGAFIAQKVVLGRTYGTLDQSKYKEPANTSNAAEIFNFSPEVYLSPPVFKPIGTITSGTYDAMAILPPIF